jgi:hypothetical protein
MGGFILTTDIASDQLRRSNRGLEGLAPLNTSIIGRFHYNTTREHEAWDGSRWREKLEIGRARLPIEHQDIRTHVLEKSAEAKKRRSRK